MADDAAQNLYESILYGGSCAFLGSIGYVCHKQSQRTCEAQPAPVFPPCLPTPCHATVAATTVVMCLSLVIPLEAMLIWITSEKLSTAVPNKADKCTYYAQRMFLAAVPFMFCTVLCCVTQDILEPMPLLGPFTTFCVAILWCQWVMESASVIYNNHLAAFKLDLSSISIQIVCFLVLNSVSFYGVIITLGIFFNLRNTVDSALKMCKVKWAGQNNYANLKRGVFVTRWVSLVTEVVLCLILQNFLFSAKTLKTSESLGVELCLIVVAANRFFCTYSKWHKMKSWP